MYIHLLRQAALKYMHRYYIIADIGFDVQNFPFNTDTPYLNKFLGTDAEQVLIEYVKSDDDRYKMEVFTGIQKFSKCIRYKSDVMLVDEQWNHIAILDLRYSESFECLFNQIFYTHAVQRHMIQIHSSMIEYSGNGLLFLGPSGIGKTTMAELWNKYRGALIINGDMNFVQETDECFLGWGTPWHGSSPYCENTSVPIKALIVLKQAPENSIRELKDFEKVQLVSNNIIYPTWLEGGMELCLETLNHLLSALPVYELSCRPDEEAVRLTEEVVFGGSV